MYKLSHENDVVIVTGLGDTLTYNIYDDSLYIRIDWVDLGKCTSIVLNKERAIEFAKAILAKHS